jgi:hypothetical protein
MIKYQQLRLKECDLGSRVTPLDDSWALETKSLPPQENGDSDYMRYYQKKILVGMRS